MLNLEFLREIKEKKTNYLLKLVCYKRLIHRETKERREKNIWDIISTINMIQTLGS